MSQLLKKIKRIVSAKIYKLLISVYIVSYPKAGRTWLRVILIKVAAKRYNLPEDIEILSQAKNFLKLPIVCFTHASYQNPHDFRRMAKSYRKKKIALLVRDPRDILVSNFFEQTKRRKGFDGDIATFARDEIYGIHKIISFYNLWYELYKDSPDFLMFRYEDMRKDSMNTVSKLLFFLGITNVKEEWISEALEAAAFDKMRAAAMKSDNVRLAPGDEKDEDTYKVRRGKIRGFVDYFEGEDLTYINKAVEKLNPVFGYQGK